MARIHPIHHLHPGGHVAAILECPICHEMNIPPIYPCTLGHNICLNCKEQGENCPLCGGVYINCRNGYLEKLLDNCRISCKYGGLGCEAIYVHGGQVQEHELECEFGLVEILLKLSSLLGRLGWCLKFMNLIETSLALSTAWSVIDC